MAHFSLPAIKDNPKGWGPTDVPADLAEIPYLPFSKADKLGKVANWTEPDGGRDDYGNRGRYQRGTEVYGAGLASAFAYHHAAEDEASFSLVTGATATKRGGGFSRGFRGRFGAQRGGGRGGQNQRYGDRGGQGGRDARGGGAMQNRRRYGYYDQKPQRLRDSSVKIGGEWKIREEVDFVRLGKLSYEAAEPEDLAVHGTLYYYDRAFDRVTAKTPKTLSDVPRNFTGLNVTTSHDPVLQELAKDAENKTIYVTDTILSAIMCATRSVYPWDIVVTKEGDSIWLDKRPGAALDIITVYENAGEPPSEAAGEKDNLNSASSLATEATIVNRLFESNTTKQSEKYQFEDPNPFLNSQNTTPPPASVAYRYRRYRLGDVDLVVRTVIDAAIFAPGSTVVSGSPELTPSDSAHPQKETLFASVKALNEYDSKASGAPEWRKKLDSQRGAVVATEIKNNGNRLARWTVEAILAGVDQIRLGFVSRTSSRSAQNHQILGVAAFKPKEFASQMNLNLSNIWGTVKAITDLIWKCEDGKYALVRDPNKPVLRLYQVPADAFDEEFDAEMGSEDGEEDAADEDEEA
ncbi:eukaryotic translation initiation factor 3 subunit D [Hyaloraphidium curvatum]|nr:eukaryotic translation initiation factor 3 subunit D [Hyaloraphidium curvatum]